MTMAFHSSLASSAPPHGFVASAERASLSWWGTLLFFSLAGGVACWGSYAFISPELWLYGPESVGESRGLAETWFSLGAIVLHPVGWVSFLYLVGLPALFGIVGHYTGMRRGVARTVDGRSRDAARWLVAQVWPLYLEQLRSQAPPSAAHLAEVYSQHAMRQDEGPQLLGWMLRCAELASISASPQQVATTRRDPAKAESDLVLAVARRLHAVVESEVARPLLLLLGAVIVLTVLSPVWIPWLG